MRIRIKVNNDDTLELKKRKGLLIFILILGVLLLLLGSSGYIIDYFFPSSSKAFHFWAGPSNFLRLMLGILFLTSLYLIRKSRDMG